MVEAGLNGAREKIQLRAEGEAAWLLLSAPNRKKVIFGLLSVNRDYIGERI